MAVAAGGRDRVQRAAGRAGAVATALVLALVVSGCTSQQGQDRTAVATVTSTVQVAAQAIPPSASAVVVPPLGGEPVAEELTAGAPAVSTVTAPTANTAPPKSSTPLESGTVSKPSASPTPGPRVTPKPAIVVTKPTNGTKAVDPLGKISVLVVGGVLTGVVLTNPAGRAVPGGSVNKNHTGWTIVPELGYGRTYTLTITARAKDGTVTTTERHFTTANAKYLVNATTAPSAGSVVGVGQPVVITFDRPFRSTAARQTVQRQVTVKASPAQDGNFRWFSDTELHWRPSSFWQAGSRVSVDVDIYGKRLAENGTYGAADRSFNFTVGRRMVAVVDAGTHQMTIRQDGKLLYTWPVSLGTDKYPTYNGTHIVTERFVTKVMDSRTWGLTGAGAYRTTVKWATRISNSGEFVHGAPWSVYAQGNSNVSHGCINLTDARAKWFYDHFRAGDPVIVRNSSGPLLKIHDGYGDWMVDARYY